MFLYPKLQEEVFESEEFGYSHTGKPRQWQGLMLDQVNGVAFNYCFPEACSTLAKLPSAKKAM